MSLNVHQMYQTSDDFKLLINTPLKKSELISINMQLLLY